SFLTTEAPVPYQPYQGKGARWRYFGHACILVEAAGMKLLFDPVISYTYETNLPRYTYRDLPDDIDYVLITHNHQDHVLLVVSNQDIIDVVGQISEGISRQIRLVCIADHRIKEQLHSRCLHQDAGMPEISPPGSLTLVGLIRHRCLSGKE